jgi:pimeloyl-ACP methyl ester carboxylesterase
MDERFCKVGDVELCYEPFGDPDRPTVLLVMGLGTQMIAWHADFCGELADRGFYVIRYDNRDVGRSTHLSDRPTPRVRELMTRRIRRPAYLLKDMAADGIGLLEELGIESAHVVGASMGGMIAQTMAAEHPDRVRSLVSIMSSTGSRWSGQPAPRILPVFLQKPASGKEAYVERIVKLFALVGSPGFERDDDELRELASTSWDRGGTEPPARRDHRERPPGAGPEADPGPNARDPRKVRPPDPPVGRTGHGARDTGRAPRSDRRNGPRPSARRLATHRGRDRAERRARCAARGSAGGLAAGAYALFAAADTILPVHGCAVVPSAAVDPVALAVTRIDLVPTPAALHTVAPAAAVERVIARAAPELVTAQEALRVVIVGTPAHAVAPLGAQHAVVARAALHPRAEADVHCQRLLAVGQV